MMKIRKDVEFKEVNTLLGKKIYVGIRNENSFIQFDSKYIQDIKYIINRGKEEEIEKICDFTMNQESIIDLFNRKGFCDNGRIVEKSFNEFERVGKEFASIKIKDGDLSENKLCVFVLMLIIITSLAVLISNSSLIASEIDYTSIQIRDILLSITIVPILVLGLHEFGHCLFARTVGIGVSKIVFGFFIVFPMIAVRYRGIHLYSTWKKIWTEFGGIFMNLFLACIGIFMKEIITNSPVVDIWIMANISMVLMNLSILGMTDGYFILTSITGLTNLRLIGYSFFAKALKKDRWKTIHKKEVVSGLALFLTSLLSFITLLLQLFYIGSLFNIDKFFLNVISVIAISFLLFRYVYKIFLLDL